MNLSAHYKNTLVHHLCKLVKIPSYSNAEGGIEGDIQSYIATEMALCKAKVNSFEAKDIPGFFNHPLCHGPERNYDNRPTVLAEIGPDDAPTLLVLAHADTVPIHFPERWNFDPFLGEIKDGKILGRGASDDAWGVASILTILKALQERETPLDKKIIFASTIDEESGVSNGTLLLKLYGVQAESAFYLDGYQMSIFAGNLGGSNLYLKPNQHISKATLDSIFLELSSNCQKFSKERESLFDIPLYRDNRMRSISISPFRYHSENGEFLQISFYTLPGEKKENFLSQLEVLVQSSLKEHDSSFDRTYREPWFEAASVPQDLPLIQYLSDSIRTIQKQEPLITTISKQDSFVLTKHANIPTIAFGPRSNIFGPGAAHQPNEYLKISEAWDGCQIAYQSILRWLEN